MDSEDLTVEEYLSMMHNSEDETHANSMDHQDKTVEDYLKENGLAPYEEIATENVEHADMTVEEYLQQIKDESTENDDQGGVLDEGLTQDADRETVDVSVEDYLKEMEAARDISVEDYLKQMESERNQSVDHASEGKSDERDQHQSPVSSPEHGKHKRRVLRISRTKREELKHVHEEGKAGKDHKADKSSKDETTAKGPHEKKQTSPRSKRRISHHKDDVDKKAETHHRGQEHGLKPSISEEKPKVSAVKPRPDTGSAAARARRRSAGKQHDAGTAHGGHEAHASTKAVDAHAATGRDARAAASSKKHDDHVTRKTSHDVGEARKSHTSMAARKASLPSKIAERPQKETTDRKTSSDVHKTHRVASDRKTSHGSSVAHTEKVAAFASKGRSSTVAGVPVEERRKQMKERASSLSHEPPVSKPRSSSSREVTAKPSHETHGRKSATLPRSRVVKQESGEKEDEPKLTPSQIRARFEKKHDGHKSHGTAARAPKSVQTVSGRHKGDKHATEQIDEHPKAEHHRPEHQKTEHHKPEHQKTEHHKPEHHKTEHHKTEHHKPEHHKTEHHKPEHHKPVHHKLVHHKTEHHQDATDTSQDKDGDAPLTTANIRSRFEAASKTGSPPKRKFTPSSKQPRPVSGAGPKKFGQVQSNKCDVCSKTVYPMEKLEADGHVYHKFCFKCAECKCTLRLGNYAALSGKIYCKPHLKQLFRLKGNYDEGFGREQHKKNWVGKDSKPVSSSNPAAADAEETGEPEAEPEPAIPVVNGEHNEVTAEA